MRNLVIVVMLANASLFAFGAVQHAGVTLGRFSEPMIIPAAIVESICGLALLIGATMLGTRAAAGWNGAVIGNFVALAGVILGVIALNLGAGPRTASNDLYHRIMLILIAASLVLLFAAKRMLKQA